MVQVLMSWSDDDLSLGSELAAIKTNLFTSEYVANINVYRYCILR